MDYNKIKGASEDERCSPGDFSQTHFTWGFLKQWEVYYSRRNGNYGKPRGCLDDKVLNSRNKPEKNARFDRPKNISETILNKVMESFDSQIILEKLRAVKYSQIKRKTSKGSKNDL